MTQPLRGDIWIATLSPTVGREQAGTRPILVVSSDFFNQGPASLVFAIPITSKDRTIRSHIQVVPPEGGLDLPSFVMCEAMRSISKTRLQRRLGTLNESTLKKVEDVLTILLDL